MNALPDLVPPAVEPTAITSVTPARSDLSGGTLLAGRYRVRSRIGEGGMSSVYLGHDERLGRDVAIKVLHPAAADLPPPPLREERVSSTLIHNNIVSIFDAGEIPEGQIGGGQTFIIMQHVPGTTAHDIAPVSCDRAVDIVRQACEGLAAAHERGIVHCDVKPSNLLIEPGGRVLVADFGVAASLETEIGDFIHGSPAYIAPERLRGASPDPRFDVFGLGGVLAFLLTGQKPSTDTTPELPSSCPTGLRSVVVKARHQQPEMRYANARDMAIALTQALNPPPESIEDRVIGEEPTRVIRPGSGATTSTPPTPVRRVERMHTPRPLRVVRASPPSSTRQPAPPLRSGTIEMPSLLGNVPQRQQEHSQPVTRLAQPRTSLATPPIARFGTALALIAAMVAAMILGGMLFGDSASDTSSAAAPAPAVAMPDLRGQTFGTAVQSLADDGLAVDRVEIIYDPASLNEVIVQSPEPGTDVTQEDEIVLIVRSRQ